jgi:hypothetical protein
MSVPSLPSLLVSHWQLSWSLEVAGAAAATLYVWASRRVRGRWPVRRTISFLAGIAYVAPTRALGISAPGDQAQAGAITWVVGDTIMVAVGLWASLASMVAVERREARADALAASGGGAPL